ncbi:hypothetical protein BJY01DRAFT_260583 [Aspergillus pseudoustus]|uniref:Zn(2)-C6 fungal-type domain-containing protein n=1 Tax=Aspergillus pseudoustus TaxID=1810923 RepID=A0ABR4IU74_9EURO
MASVCDHCRLRRRRCDRLRPKCSFCVSQGVECVYGQSSESSPSPLVQELMSIRERLELLTPLLEPRRQPSTRSNHASPARNFPPLSIKSPHLMQILGLPSDLASVLYRLEAALPPVVETSAEPECVESPDLLLPRFQEKVHQWYPILHPEFTVHFLESNAAGFSPSTTSCLSLLVSSLASLRHGHPNSNAAFSMLPIVLQESSVTSAQCLVLFSIYFVSLHQPRQAYTYIRLAFLKIQPLLKNPYLTQELSEFNLITRLYWTIYLIERLVFVHRILSTHLNPSSSPKMSSSSRTIPMPTSAYIWDYAAGSNTPWGRSPLSGTPPSGQGYLSNSDLAAEVQLQLVLNSHTDAAAVAVDLSNTYSTDSIHTLESGPPLASSLQDVLSPYTQSDPNHINSDSSPICLAKYHIQEVSTYWPVIYRIILDGLSDPELLPYGPLFFESVASFLYAAQLAIAVCPAKTWFLSASMYTISMVAVRALEVPCLRSLVQPRFLECLDAAVDAMRSPSQLSPSIRYMRESLNDRLGMARV